jgi:coenzyme F420-reducing hydrogenase alpha subunit
MSETSRTVRVEMLTRVEGEGAVTLRLRDQRVTAVELNIFEPPRLFEAFLCGRRLEEAPDITARICGICPVAYQMSAVHALEAALGIAISPEIRALRRLLYCGEWIESHALHIHLLHAPDFFGCANAIELARLQPEAIRRGLMLKKYGNQIVELLGGRAVHPINVAVGGFYRAPPPEAMAALVPALEWGLQAAIDTVHWTAGFEVPPVQHDYTFVALHHDDEYAMNEGRIVSNRGLDIPPADFLQHVVERQVPHSTALHAVFRESGQTYLVGPLARLALNAAQLGPTARALAAHYGLDRPCGNPYRSIVARAIEVVQAYEEALTIVRHYRPPQPPRVAYAPRAGHGAAATEAPRGLLYHDYTVDAQGHLVAARIIPPTSQNQAQIERDLEQIAQRLLPADDARLALACEQAVRNYDPCISCSTHFLTVRVERD